MTLMGYSALDKFLLKSITITANNPTLISLCDNTMAFIEKLQLKLSVHVALYIGPVFFLKLWISFVFIELVKFATPGSWPAFRNLVTKIDNC